MRLLVSEVALGSVGRGAFDEGSVGHGAFDGRLEDAYADLVLSRPTAAPGRAHVSLGMVATVDGATAVAGRSGGVGGPADQVAFRRLRGACDAVLVGAGTVRAETYGPPAGDADRRRRREEAGLTPVPGLVVLSGRLDLDVGHRVFSDPDAEVVVVTHAGAPADRRAALAEVCEVVVLGDDTVDLDALTRWCGARGWTGLLCEGGPSLNGALAAADLVDEVFVTIAPQLVGGPSARLISGPELDPPRALELVELHLHEHELLARYRIRR